MKRRLFLALMACIMALGASAQRKELLDMLPVKPHHIVMLGNSLTHGGEWAELLDNPNVINRGISGDTTDGVLARLPNIIKGQPAQLFLLIGVNDISHNLTADSISRNILRIVDEVHAGSPNTEIFVQSLLPFNQSFGRYKRLDGKEPLVTEINAILEPAVKERGFTWININPLFADENGNLRKELTGDGLHLLAPGYDIWRNALKPYLKPAECTCEAHKLGRKVSDGAKTAAKETKKFGKKVAKAAKAAAKEAKKEFSEAEGK